MGGDVAGIADRQTVIVRRTAQLFDDLERGGFLALQTERIDGIDDGDRRMLGDFLHQLHAGIEIALDLQHFGTMNHGLRQFAEGDLAIRNQHETGDAGARRIRCCRGRGVAGGSADDGATPASTALVTAMVMPRSLKEPVGLRPSYFT